MENSWIKLTRGIQKHWVFDDPNYLKAWITILLNVNFKDGKQLIDGDLIICKRGQSILSLQSWVKLLGKDWTIQKVRTFFKLLQKDNMANIEGLRKTTRLSVCNYETYQNEQHTANTQLTDSQHTANTQLTTIEESKERKEGKEERIKEKKSCDLFLDIWNNSSWTKKYSPHSESLKEKIDKNISRIANEYGENFFIDFKKALEEKSFIKDQTWFNAPNVATRKDVLERFINGTYDFMGEKKISPNRPLKNDISNFYQNNEFME